MPATASIQIQAIDQSNGSNVFSTLSTGQIQCSGLSDLIDKNNIKCNYAIVNGSKIISVTNVLLSNNNIYNVSRSTSTDWSLKIQINNLINPNVSGDISLNFIIRTLDQNG